jgi:glycerol-3-phosphate dehydrogenase
MSEVANDIPTVDVLILGGGINGCGTFRDLCAQDIDCLLLEREDFCAGASAGSSRLMHGGLKYLETGEFRLVRESVEERNRLLKNAPHYVSPLATILPLRSRFGGIVPSILRFLGRKAALNDRGSLITRAGMTVYDAFSRRINALPGFQMLSRQALEDYVAGLDDGITGAALYYEGQLSHAERLGLELILDGLALHEGAQALNHVDLLGAEGGVVWYCHGGQMQAVRPRIIVNAGGAWIDRINTILGQPTQMMGGSKGAHLVVDHPALLAALNGHMIYFGTGDGRVNLVYPFMERVLIGSTDIKIEDPDTATCEDHEADYLRAVVSEIFPHITVEPGQIVYRFSGVRPLPRADGNIGMVTRDHAIARLTLDGGTETLCLIGGKWTTFRKFAEQTTDEVLAALGKTRRQSTETMAIGGGRDFPAPSARAGWIAARAANYALSESRVDTLLSRYGTRAEALMTDLAVSDTPLRSLPDYSREELTFLTRHEHVGSTEDLVKRRTAIAISGCLSAAAKQEITALLNELKPSLTQASPIDVIDSSG